MNQIKAESYNDKLGNTNFTVSFIKDNGEILKKKLGLKKFCELLLDSQVNEVKLNQIPSDFFPKDMIDCKFADTENYKITWRENGRKRQFIFGVTDQHYILPFPNLVFQLHVSNGHVVEKKVFAEADGVLYNYPFGNVYDSGAICMGNIVSTDVTKRVGSFSEEFFMGVTNNDLYRSDRNSKGFTQSELCEYVSKMDIFPVEILIKSKLSIKDLTA